MAFRTSISNSFRSISKANSESIFAYTKEKLKEKIMQNELTLEQALTIRYDYKNNNIIFPRMVKQNWVGFLKYCNYTDKMEITNKNNITELSPLFRHSLFTLDILGVVKELVGPNSHERLEYNDKPTLK